MSVPDKVMMRDVEITELFGVMIPTVRFNIRTILKTGIATGDYINGATWVGNNVLPDYHGLHMIIALAFRIPKSARYSKMSKIMSKRLKKRWLLKSKIDFGNLKLKS